MSHMDDVKLGAYTLKSKRKISCTLCLLNSQVVGVGSHKHYSMLTKVNFNQSVLFCPCKSI